jgi:uncharacterized Zn-finger protein
MATPLLDNHATMPGEKRFARTTGLRVIAPHDKNLACAGSVKPIITVPK